MNQNRIIIWHIMSITYFKHIIIIYTYVGNNLPKHYRKMDACIDQVHRTLCTSNDIGFQLKLISDPDV